MNIQEDLQNVLGFKIEMRLKSEHVFERQLSRFEKLIRKVKSSMSQKS